MIIKNGARQNGRMSRELMFFECKPDTLRENTLNVRNADADATRRCAVLKKKSRKKKQKDCVVRVQPLPSPPLSLKSRYCSVGNEECI